MRGNFKVGIGIITLMMILVTATVPSYGKTQITVQTYYDPALPTGRALTKLFSEFEQANPDIDIIHIFVPFAQLIRTILQQAITGSLPDVVFADSPDVRHLATAGVFRDITPLVKEWGQWDDLFVGAQYATTVDNKIYAIQFRTNNLALWYNKDILRKAGLERPPATWQELLDACQAIKSRAPEAYCIGFSAVDSEEGTWQFLPFLWSNGGSLLELDQPRAVEALQLWTTLVERGYAPRDVVNWVQNDVRVRFTMGQLAMMINGPWELPKTRESGVRFDLAPIPVPRAGMRPVMPMGGEVFGLSSTIDPSKVNAAWSLIKFVVEPGNIARFAVEDGSLPTRRSAIPMVTERDPQLGFFAHQAQYALPRPIMGGNERYTEVSAITRRYIQASLAGLMKPEEAFRRAAAQIRQLFDSEAEYQAAVNRAREALRSVSSGQ